MPNPNPSPKTRWKTGVSGNPHGHPKSNLRHLLGKYLGEKDKDTLKAREQMLVERVFKLAAGGDMDAVRFIWERVEGKVPDKMELERKDPCPHMSDKDLAEALLAAGKQKP